MLIDMHIHPIFYGDICEDEKELEFDSKDRVEFSLESDEKEKNELVYTYPANCISTLLSTWTIHALSAAHKTHLKIKTIKAVLASKGAR